MSTAAQIVFDILTIVAILAGPVLAIQIQKYLEEKRELKRRKIRVFRELMVTRSTVLSPRHVEALNTIQMEFSAKDPNEKKVLDAWQLYINHLSRRNVPDAATWTARGPEILEDLLLEMALCLGYREFNKAKIKAEAYSPQYFADLEDEQNELRRAAIEVFKGRQVLRVGVTEDPAQVRAQRAGTMPPGS